MEDKNEKPTAPGENGLVASTRYSRQRCVEGSVLPNRILDLLQNGDKSVFLPTVNEATNISFRADTVNQSLSSSNLLFLSSNKLLSESFTFH